MLKESPLTFYMPALRQTETLEIFDLDGTLTNMDVAAALREESGSSLEIREYLIAAVHYLCEKIDGLRPEAVLPELRPKMLSVALPNRALDKNWGRFPEKGTGEMKRISPAVDHFFLVRTGVKLYLEDLYAENRRNVLGERIREFLQGNWMEPMYRRANEAAWKHAEMDDDSIGVLEDRIRREALLVIMTNSDTAKAVAMLNKAGFGDDRIIEGGVERGKIGIVGDARKWEVDPNFTVDDMFYGDEMDLSLYYRQPGIVVDIRRGRFHGQVDSLMQASGARRAWMATDMPELDGYPFMNWRQFRPNLVVRTNPTSAPASIVAAESIMGVKTGGKLSGLTGDLE